MWFTLSSLQFESFRFLSDRIEDLKRELPSYLAKVDDVSSEVDKLARVVGRNMQINSLTGLLLAN